LTCRLFNDLLSITEMQNRISLFNVLCV